MGRQATRAMHLFGNVPTVTVGIGWSELEGAGNLIDMLDASDGESGVVMANVAPRHGTWKKWPNGTPFGYFYYRKTLVVSTIADNMLSMVKKFGIAEKLFLTDVPTVIDEMIKRGKLEEFHRSTITNSQFRSYDYMPRLAKWIVDGEDVPSTEYDFGDIGDVSPAVWWVDNFGNCKTTILPHEIDHKIGKKIETKAGELTCYDRLKDVPDGVMGLIVGSSGLREQRFLEIVVQGGSAAKELDLEVGSLIFN